VTRRTSSGAWRCARSEEHWGTHVGYARLCSALHEATKSEGGGRAVTVFLLSGSMGGPKGKLSVPLGTWFNERGDPSVPLGMWFNERGDPSVPLKIWINEGGVPVLHWTSGSMGVRGDGFTRRALEGAQQRASARDTPSLPQRAASREGQEKCVPCHVVHAQP